MMYAGPPPLKPGGTFGPPHRISHARPLLADEDESSYAMQYTNGPAPIEVESECPLSFTFCDPVFRDPYGQVAATFSVSSPH